MFSAEALRQIASQHQANIQNLGNHDQAALQPNTDIDRARYTIQQVLYKGQNGYVYTAIHQATQKGVIIKELFPMVPIKIDNDVLHAKRQAGQKNLYFEPMHTNTLSHFEQVKAKFLLEAETLKQVKGPYFVELLDTFEVNATAYIVLEQIHYPTLEVLLQSKEPITSDQLKGIFDSLLDAVEALHQQGIIHRDLKPSNIFVLPTQVVLADFGTARQYAGGTPNKFTTMYTEAYCAPEQQLTGGDIGPWSDIYALGKILADLLQQLAASPEAHNHHKNHNHLLNPTFQESLLATHYEQRFQSIKQIRQALNMLIQAEQQIDNNYALITRSNNRKLNRYRLVIATTLGLFVVTMGLNLAMGMGLLKSPLAFSGATLANESQEDSPNHIEITGSSDQVAISKSTATTEISSADAISSGSSVQVTTSPSNSPSNTLANSPSNASSNTPSTGLLSAPSTTPSSNVVAQEVTNIQDTSLPLADLQKKESPTQISFNVGNPYKVKVNSEIEVSWQEIVGSVSYQVSLTNIESWEVVFSNQKQDHTSINLSPYNLPAGHYRLYVQNLNSAGSALLSSYIDIAVEKTATLLPAPIVKATSLNIAKGESGRLDWTFQLPVDSTIPLASINYQVVISQIKDANNKGISSQDIVVNRSETNIDLTPYLKDSGTYAIKVFAQKSDEKLTSLADLVTVHYTGENSLRPLQFITPENTLFETGQPRKLSWIALPEATQYHLRVYFMASGLSYIDVMGLTSATYDLGSANLPFGMYHAQIRYKTAAPGGNATSPGTWSPFTDLHFSCGKN